MSQQCNDALQYTWADYNYLDQHVIDRILEMDQCHDVLIYGPIQICISIQIVAGLLLSVVKA